MASLIFYYGVMGSGKTTELIKTYEIYKRKGLDPVVIKPIIEKVLFSDGELQHLDFLNINLYRLIILKI